MTPGVLINSTRNLKLMRTASWLHRIGKDLRDVRQIFHLVPQPHSI